MLFLLLFVLQIVLTDVAFEGIESKENKSLRPENLPLDIVHSEMQSDVNAESKSLLGSGSQNCKYEIVIMI